MDADALDALTAYASRDLLSAIETAFDEESPEGEILLLDSVELDLGDIPYPDYGQEWACRLRDKLAALIREKRRSAAHGGRPGERRLDKAAADLDKLAHFLESGLLPWQESPESADAHERLLTDSFAAPAEALLATLRRAGDRESVLDRLVLQFAPACLAELLARLNALDPGYITAEMARLSKARELGGAERRHWRALLERSLDAAPMPPAELFAGAWSDASFASLSDARQGYAPMRELVPTARREAGPAAQRPPAILSAAAPTDPPTDVHYVLEQIVAHLARNPAVSPENRAGLLAAISAWAARAADRSAFLLRVLDDLKNGRILDLEAAAEETGRHEFADRAVSMDSGTAATEGAGDGASLKTERLAGLGLVDDAKNEADPARNARSIDRDAGAGFSPRPLAAFPVSGRANAEAGDAVSSGDLSATAADGDFAAWARLAEALSEERLRECCDLLDRRFALTVAAYADVLPAGRGRREVWVAALAHRAAGGLPEALPGQLARRVAQALADEAALAVSAPGFSGRENRGYLPARPARDAAESSPGRPFLQPAAASEPAQADALLHEIAAYLARDPAVTPECRARLLASMSVWAARAEDGTAFLRRVLHDLTVGRGADPKAAVLQAGSMPDLPTAQGSAPDPLAQTRTARAAPGRTGEAISEAPPTAERFDTPDEETTGASADMPGSRGRFLAEASASGRPAYRDDDVFTDAFDATHSLASPDRPSGAATQNSLRDAARALERTPDAPQAAIESDALSETPSSRPAVERAAAWIGLVAGLPEDVVREVCALFDPGLAFAVAAHVQALPAGATRRGLWIAALAYRPAGHAHDALSAALARRVAQAIEGEPIGESVAERARALPAGAQEARVADGSAPAAFSGQAGPFGPTPVSPDLSAGPNGDANASGRLEADAFKRPADFVPPRAVLSATASGSAVEDEAAAAHRDAPRSALPLAAGRTCALDEGAEESPSRPFPPDARVAYPHIAERSANGAAPKSEASGFADEDSRDLPARSASASDADAASVSLSENDPLRAIAARLAEASALLPELRAWALAAISVQAARTEDRTAFLRRILEAWAGGGNSEPPASAEIAAALAYALGAASAGRTEAAENSAQTGAEVRISPVSDATDKLEDTGLAESMLVGALEGDASNGAAAWPVLAEMFPEALLREGCERFDPRLAQAAQAYADRLPQGAIRRGAWTAALAHGASGGSPETWSRLWKGRFGQVFAAMASVAAERSAGTSPILRGSAVRGDADNARDRLAGADGGDSPVSRTPGGAGGDPPESLSGLLLEPSIESANAPGAEPEAISPSQERVAEPPVVAGATAEAGRAAPEGLSADVGAKPETPADLAEAPPDGTGEDSRPRLSIPASAALALPDPGRTNLERMREAEASASARSSEASADSRPADPSTQIPASAQNAPDASEPAASAAPPAVSAAIDDQSGSARDYAAAGRDISAPREDKPDMRSSRPVFAAAEPSSGDGRVPVVAVFGEVARSADETAPGYSSGASLMPIGAGQPADAEALQAIAARLAQIPAATAENRESLLAAISAWAGRARDRAAFWRRVSDDLDAGRNLDLEAAALAADAAPPAAATAENSPYPGARPPEGPDVPAETVSASAVAERPGGEIAPPPARLADAPRVETETAPPPNGADAQAWARFAERLPEKTLREWCLLLDPGVARLAEVHARALPAGEARRRLWAAALAHRAAGGGPDALSAELARLSGLAGATPRQAATPAVPPDPAEMRPTAPTRPHPGPPSDRPVRAADTERPETGGPIYILNAGLVLAAPYLPRLLAMFGLTANGAFVDPAAQARAAHIMQFMVDESVSSPEYRLVLNKLLCGLRTGKPIPPEISISETERETVESLLAAIVQNWGALGNTSIAGLRAAFLQREGWLRLRDGAWRLEVLPKPYDMLLDRLPWSFSVVKYAWMERPVHVDWR